MKDNNKIKWLKLLLVTELFQCFYEKRNCDEERRIMDDCDLEKENKADLRFFKPNAETKKIWKKISIELQLESYTQKKQKQIYKYAVAASVAIVVTAGYWFAPNVFKNSIDFAKVLSEETNKKIPIGTDKAILTLENGVEVPLTKGVNYKTNNIQSNGTQIVYNTALLTVNNGIKIPNNYLTIPRGGQFCIQLADSTKVWLNADSKLKYPVHFIEGETRQVELVYGEAYFDVSPSSSHKGADFKVVTGLQEVTVLGTEFNIKAYKEDANIYTTLIEGKVAVSTQNNKNVLVPKQQSILNTHNHQLRIQEIDMYNVTSWKQGVFSFKGTTLKEIMIVLSRWYDVEIIFENTALEEIKFNGVLRKDQQLEKILETIQKTKFINAFTLKNKTIILK